MDERKIKMLLKLLDGLDGDMDSSLASKLKKPDAKVSVTEISSDEVDPSKEVEADVPEVEAEVETEEDDDYSDGSALMQRILENRKKRKAAEEDLEEE